MLMQNLGGGGQIRCVMGNVEVANWPFRDCEETGLMLCRIALWDCFGDAISFFNGCYEVARETGSKFVFKQRHGSHVGLPKQ